MLKPLLAITLGDINGVGPEILAKALAHPEVWAQCRPLVIGSAKAYEQARALVGRGPSAQTVETPDEADAIIAAGAVPFLEGEVQAPAVQFGALDPAAAKCALAWLDLAVELAMRGDVAGIVTCPLNKAGIHQAGYAFQGHTDYIAEKLGAPDYRMCLFAGNLRVVHNTAHLPLREALDWITPERVAATIRVADAGLRQMGARRRRIAVAGLNPHAGESGAFGREEIEAIAPAVKRCSAEGVDCSGPYPPDTLFGKLRDGEFDLVVAMYHDQGHIPVKLVAMDEGVNVTLGIPIVRTSVDHGTAYDIAGTGKARENSLCAAIALAAAMASRAQEVTR
ncbi:MAG: 4-hydroxythreonine-4-phosphate dehydrogenase PdxA [Candidatus Hydrogenedentales bacterium]